MLTTKLATLCVVVPALAFAGCGGKSDKDQITDIVNQGSKDPQSVCDHAAKKLLDSIGGMDKCKSAAKSSGAEDPDAKINSITVSGDKATAKITGKEGAQTINFVKEGGDWKVGA